MPTEVAISDGGAPRIVGRVKPGEYIPLAGFFTPEDKILGLHCREDDSGCEIYYLDPMHTIEDRTVPTTPQEIYTQDRMVWSFGPGEYYTQILRAPSGWQFTVIFKHHVAIKELELPG